MKIRRRRQKKFSREDTANLLPALVSETKDAVYEPEPVVKPKRKGLAPFKLLREVVRKPDFSYQAFMLLMTFANTDQMRIDRQIADVSTTIEKVKTATDVLGSTMRSLQSAAEAPRNIRKLFE
ncbi:MAG: hypothetical protein E6713_13335 [Sporomusaceae bacterium]|nr:hypothetical protein [Sporomusaceae bacterium]